MTKPIKLEMNKGSVFENQIIFTKEERSILHRMFEYCMRTAHGAEYAKLVILRNKLLSK